MNIYTIWQFPSPPGPTFLLSYFDCRVPVFGALQDRSRRQFASGRTWRSDCDRRIAIHDGQALHGIYFVCTSSEHRIVCRAHRLSCCCGYYSARICSGVLGSPRSAPRLLDPREHRRGGFLRFEVIMTVRDLDPWSDRRGKAPATRGHQYHPMRFRRSLPAIIARTIFPASSSTENMPRPELLDYLPLLRSSLLWANCLLLMRRGAEAVSQIAAAPASLYRCSCCDHRRFLPRIRRRLRATFAFRTSFVDVQRPAINPLPLRPLMEHSLPHRRHLDKCEAPCLSSVTVCHYVHPIDAAVGFEHGTNGIFGCPKTRGCEQKCFQFLILLSEFAEQLIRQNRT